MLVILVNRLPNIINIILEISILVKYYTMFNIGDETKNPKRTIPLAIILTLFLVTLSYCGVASVLTLMWPYYDQVCLKIKTIIDQP